MVFKKLLQIFKHSKELREADMIDEIDQWYKKVEQPKEKLSKIEVISSWIKSAKLEHRDTIEELIFRYAEDDFEFERMMNISDTHFAYLEKQEEQIFH